jgi:hypothetical protein
MGRVPWAVTESRHIYCMKKNNCRGNMVLDEAHTFLVSSHWVNPIVYAVFYTERRPKKRHGRCFDCLKWGGGGGGGGDGANETKP